VAALMFDKNGCGGMDAYLAKTIIFNQAATKDFPSPRCFVGNGTQPKHVNAIAAVDFVPPSPPCPGSGLVADLDCDMAIGPSDFQKLLVCVTGAGVGPIGGGCTCADFPESPPDGDVDLRDFIHFTRAYSGNTSSPAAVTLNLSSPSAGQTVQPGATISWSLAATVSATDNDGLAAISVDLVQDAGNPRFFDIPSATVVGSGMEGFSPPDGVANPGTGGSGYGGTPLGTAGAKNLRQIGGTQNTFGEEGHTGVGTDFDVDPSVGQSGAQVIAQGSFTAPGRQGTYVFRIENGLANVLDTVNPQPTPPASWPASSANVNLSSSSFTVTVPYDVVPLDFDADGDVDLDDFAEMQACYDPYGSVASGCADQDVNGDNVVNDMDV